jgi:hypothetical protein
MSLMSMDLNALADGIGMVSFDNSVNQLLTCVDNQDLNKKFTE